MMIPETELTQQTNNQAHPRAAEPEATVLPDLIEIARQEAACDRALTQLRAFSVDDEALKTLQRDAQHNPNRASCNTFNLAAQMLYNEQLKAYLDQRLESDASTLISKFKGTLEAESLRHTLNVISDLSDEKDVQKAADFFSQAAAQQRQNTHFRILALLAKLKVAQMRLLVGDKDKNLRQQFEALTQELETEILPIRSSIVLRRLLARFGAKTAKGS